MYTHSTQHAPVVRCRALVLKPGHTGERQSHWAAIEGEGCTLPATGLNPLLLWLQAAQSAHAAYGRVPHLIVLMPDTYTVQH